MSAISLHDVSAWIGVSARVRVCPRYLEYVVFKDYAAKVCFVTPDVTQFIKLYEGENTAQNMHFSS